MLDGPKKQPANEAPTILISGRDKTRCDTIRRALLPYWSDHKIVWQSSALKTLNFLWQQADRQPKLIIVLVVGIDAPQIELIQELAVPSSARGTPFTLVITDCERDNILFEFVRLTGGDMIVHMEDLAAQLPKIRSLVNDHWFIT